MLPDAQGQKKHSLLNAPQKMLYHFLLTCKCRSILLFITIQKNNMYICKQLSTLFGFMPFLW